MFDTTRIQWILLGAVLLLSTLLRLVGIGSGLPYVLNTDESLIVNHAIAFGTGDLNPHFFVYPSLLMYLLFAIYGAIFVIGWLIGAFGSTGDFARTFFTDATLFYLPGRLVSMASGVASVCGVFIVARRYYNQWVGILASLFLACSVLHVQYSQILKTQVPAGFLVVLGLWAACRLYERGGGWKSYGLVGAIAGLAASTVYTAGLLLFSALLAHVLRVRDQRRKGQATRLVNGSPLLAVVVSVIAFVAGSPFAVLDSRNFLGDITSTGNVMLDSGVWVKSWHYPFSSLVSTMGAPLGVLALLSLVWAFIRRRPVDLILASQPVCLGLFHAFFPMKQPHHMLLAFPALCVLSARFLSEVVTLSLPAWRIKPVVLGSLALAIAAGPAWLSYSVARRLGLPDTRTVAKQWVEQNIPVGARILMDSGKYYLGQFGPPLRLSRWTLQYFIDRGEALAGRNLAQREGTRRVGYSGEAAYFRRQLEATGGEGGYDVIQILHDEGAPDLRPLSLEEYLAMGAQYAIVNPGSCVTRYRSGGDADSQFPEKARAYRELYQAIAEHGTLMKEFSPAANLAGPRILVYRLPQHIPATTTIREATE